MLIDTSILMVTVVCLLLTSLVLNKIGLYTLIIALKAVVAYCFLSYSLVAQMIYYPLSVFSLIPVYQVVTVPSDELSTTFSSNFLCVS